VYDQPCCCRRKGRETYALVRPCVQVARAGLNTCERICAFTTVGADSDAPRLPEIKNRIMATVGLLKGVVDTMAKSRPAGYGATDAGREWCLKALHPADEAVPDAGYPDDTNFPTVNSSYNMLFHLAAPSSDQGNWGYDMSFVPDPIQPLVYIRSTTQGGVETSWHSFLNPQLMLEGNQPSYEDGRASFSQLFKQYRLTYASVTVTQDAPALSDQGIITCVQAPAEMMETNASVVLTSHADVKGPDKVLKEKLGLGPGVSSALIVAQHVRCFDPNDNPNGMFTTGVSMPGAYVGKSKDGLYVPLKLSRSAAQWTTPKDEYILGPQIDFGNPSGYDGGSMVSLPTVAPAPSTLFWPFGMESGVVAAWTDVLHDFEGTRLISWLNGNIAHISVQNVSPGTVFTLRVRMGLECKVGPGSLLSTQQKMSAVVDPVAIESYFAISRQLADAYPGAYNDLGTLWEVIKGVAKGALGLFSNLPGPAGIISGVLHSTWDDADKRRAARREEERLKKEAAVIEVPVPMAPNKPLPLPPIKRAPMKPLPMTTVRHQLAKAEKAVGRQVLAASSAPSYK